MSGAGTSSMSGTGGAIATGGVAGTGNAAVAGSVSGGAGGSGAGAASGSGGTGLGAAGLGGAGGSPSSGGTVGVAGSATSAGGSPSGASCTPNANGTFVANDDVVLDAKTCLSWTKESVGGKGLAEATMYCEGLTRGGFSDWRVPTASEAATIITQCGMYPPIDTNVFTISGDGIWTTTESGSIAGPDAKVCGLGQNTGQYYDFGPVGAQHTRCVRGMGSFPMVKGCKDAQGCTNW